MLSAIRAPLPVSRLRRARLAEARAALASDESAWTLPATPAPSGDQLAELKSRLLQLCAVTARGQAAGLFTERIDLEDVVLRLEDCAADAKFQQAGTWRLVYSNVEPFRSSPFFAAFQAAVGSEDVASAVFRLTAALPVAGSSGAMGAVTQRVSLPPSGEGRLVSEVRLSLYGLLSGTVVTEARLRQDEADPRGTLRCVVESTRVADSSLPFSLDSIVAPVETAFAALKGAPLEVMLHCRFADDSLRIVRTGERQDQIFVYAREA